MKIGITCYPTYGGSGALATELGLALARRGHEVHFITYAMPFRLRGYTERVYFHEVDTRMGRYPLFDHFPYTLALASKQHEVALRERLDLLHVHYAIPHATTAFLAREMLGSAQPVKVITTSAPTWAAVSSRLRTRPATQCAVNAPISAPSVVATSSPASAVRSMRVRK